VTSPVAPPVAAPLAARFSALRHPDYRRYFALTMLSQIADNIEHVISYWVMFQAFHSPVLGGFAVISHWVPYLLFSVYTGALADRYDCRKLIQLSQGLFMVASLSWAVLFVTGWLQVWHAAVILLVHGAAGVIGAPATQLMIHDIVGAGRLPSAIRLAATGRYLAILLGPAIGGGLMLLLGPAYGLFANAVIYLPFTLYLTRIRYTGHSHDAAAARRTPRFGWAETRHLLGEARKDPRLLSMVALGGITSFFVGNAFQAQMPEYAHHLGTDEAGTWYSMLLAANAAGAVVGALGLEAVSAVKPRTRTAIACAIAWGVLMAFFPAAHTYRVAVVLLVLAGIFNIAFTSMAQTIIQLFAPPRIRGSMVGLFNSSILGLRAGSGLTVGVLGGVIGVQWSLTLSSLAVVVIALGLLVVDARTRPASTAAGPA
jgi:MFS family permease